MIAAAPKNSARLLCVDRDFEVELALLDLLSGDQSSTRFVQAILSYMPTETTVVAPEHVLHCLTSFARQDSYLLGARSAQGQGQTAIKLIGRIVDGREPNFDNNLQTTALSMTIMWKQGNIQFMSITQA